VEDVDNLVLLDGDPQVMRYLSGAPTPRDVIEHETLPRFFSYYERRERYGIWAAIEKTTGTFTGRVGYGKHLDDGRPCRAAAGPRSL